MKFPNYWVKISNCVKKTQENSREYRETIQCSHRDLIEMEVTKIKQKSFD